MMCHSNRSCGHRLENGDNFADTALGDVGRAMPNATAIGVDHMAKIID